LNAPDAAARDARRLHFILDRIERIEGYTVGGWAAYQGNTLIRDAVERNLEILSDMAGRTMEAFQKQHPQIAWREMREFRNVLAHGYESTDNTLVWEAVAHDLPALKAAIVAALADDAPSTPPAPAPA